ncbi:MAG: RNA-directed DNA polymerase [Verrucomicrobiota bacterium]
MAKSIKPDTVLDTSLNWARTHLLKHGESDLFPVPFEYEAYNANWPLVLAHFSMVDLAAHEISPALRFMVPKSRTGFRAAAQLDPFDSLLYTAFTYEMAGEIEQFRAEPSLKVACSYRLDIQPDGQFFQKHSGWPDFHGRSVELANKKECKYVLCADVSDFYNQISHHRVQNALSSAGVLDDRSKNVERFLSNLTAHHHSRGLPVGPSASILLSEACLADVDNYLIRKGYKHTRYVDDFRVFCDSERKAIQGLHDLSEYLYTAHRLTFQGGKTRLLEKSRFQQLELTNPEDLEKTSKMSHFKELLDGFDFSPYGDVDPEAIGEVEKEAVRDTIKDLFEEVVSNKPFQSGLARYILRRAASLRTRIIFEKAMESYQTLMPVFRDLILFLVAVHDKKNCRTLSEFFRMLLQDSNYKSLGFVQYWVLDAIVRAPHLFDAATAIDLAENSDNQIRDRMAALLARSYQQVDCVRSKKETWANSPAWGQRAIVWAGKILPKDEHRSWLKAIANYPILQTSLIAKAVLAGH